MAFAVIALFLLPSLASPVLGLRMEKAGSTLRHWLESDQCVKLDLPSMSTDSTLRLLRDTDGVMFMFDLFQKGLLKHALGMPSEHSGSATSVLQRDHHEEHKAKEDDFKVMLKATLPKDAADCCKTALAECFGAAWVHEDGTWQMLISKEHHKDDIDTCMNAAQTDCTSDSTCLDNAHDLDKFLKLATVHLRRNGVLDDTQLEQVVKAYGVHLGYELASFPKELFLQQLGMQSQVAATPVCDRVLRITPSWEAHQQIAAGAREIVSLVLPSKPLKPNGILRRLHSGKEIMDPIALDQKAVLSADDILDQPMRAQPGHGKAIHYLVN